MAASCKHCDKTWDSLAWAHCAVCHETFLSVAFFDMHRKKGGCWQDEQATLDLIGLNDVWATEEAHESRAAIATRLAEGKRKKAA